MKTVEGIERYRVFSPLLVTGFEQTKKVRCLAGISGASAGHITEPITSGGQEIPCNKKTPWQATHLMYFTPVDIKEVL